MVNTSFRVWPHGDRRLYRLGIKVDYGGMDERYEMNKTIASRLNVRSMLNYSSVTVAYTVTRDPVTAIQISPDCRFPKPPSQHF